MSDLCYDWSIGKKSGELKVDRDLDVTEFGWMSEIVCEICLPQDL